MAADPLPPPQDGPAPRRPILDEGGISLSAAGRPHGRSPVTLWRWCRRGIRRGGRVVRLEYVRCGRAILTSRPAVARFMQALADADGEPPAPAPIRDDAAPRPPSRRQREFRQAEATLAAAGF